MQKKKTDKIQHAFMMKKKKNLETTAIKET